MSVGNAVAVDDEAAGGINADTIDWTVERQRHAGVAEAVGEAVETSSAFSVLGRCGRDWAGGHACGGEPAAQLLRRESQASRRKLRRVAVGLDHIGGSATVADIAAVVAAEK